MNRYLALPLLLLCALNSGCSSSRLQSTDGQTHWLEQCGSSADCGALACICGVCIETCTEVSGCAQMAELERVCVSRSVLSGAACDTEPSDLRLCLPSCKRASDCDALGAGLECSEDGVCVPSAVHADAGLQSDLPADSGLGGQPGAGAQVSDAGAVVDATVIDEAGPLGTESDTFDAGSIAPLDLSCTNDEQVEGSGDFEIIASDLFGEAMAVASEGTIYASRSVESNTVLAEIKDSSVEPFAPSISEPHLLKVDGNDLFVGSSLDALVTITKIDRTTEASVNVGRQPLSNPLGISIEDDFVYWMADAAEFPNFGRVFRSPRTPGEDTLLAEVSGFPVVDSLCSVGDSLYFLVQIAADDVRMFRVAKDGSGELEMLSNAPADVTDMRCDGHDLFLALRGSVDALGNPTGGRGIARMDPATGESVALFEGTAEPPTFMSIGETYVYWVISNEHLPTQSVFRGRKDGRGEAQRLVTLQDGWIVPLRAHGDDLYWTAVCPRDGGDSLGQRHIIRIPSP